MIVIRHRAKGGGRRRYGCAPAEVHNRVQAILGQHVDIIADGVLIVYAAIRGGHVVDPQPAVLVQTDPYRVRMPHADDLVGRGISRPVEDTPASNTRELGT